MGSMSPNSKVSLAQAESSGGVGGGWGGGRAIMHHKAQWVCGFRRDAKCAATPATALIADATMAASVRGDSLVDHGQVDEAAPLDLVAVRGRGVEGPEPRVGEEDAAVQIRPILHLVDLQGAAGGALVRGDHRPWSRGPGLCGLFKPDERGSDGESFMVDSRRYFRHGPCGG
jgi:hypothetical protein